MLEDPCKQKFLEDVLKKSILYKGVWECGVILVTSASLAAIMAFIHSKGGEKESLDCSYLDYSLC